MLAIQTFLDGKTQHSEMILKKSDILHFEVYKIEFYRLEMVVNLFEILAQQMLFLTLQVADFARALSTDQTFVFGVLEP